MNEQEKIVQEIRLNYLVYPLRFFSENVLYYENAKTKAKYLYRNSAQLNGIFGKVLNKICLAYICDYIQLERHSNIQNLVAKINWKGFDSESHPFINFLSFMYQNDLSIQHNVEGLDIFYEEFLIFDKEYSNCDNMNYFINSLTLRTNEEENVDELYESFSTFMSKDDAKSFVKSDIGCRVLGFIELMDFIDKLNTMIEVRGKNKLVKECIYCIYYVELTILSLYQPAILKFIDLFNKILKEASYLSLALIKKEVFIDFDGWYKELHSDISKTKSNLARAVNYKMNFIKKLMEPYHKLTTQISGRLVVNEEDAVIEENLGKVVYSAEEIYI